MIEVEKKFIFSKEDKKRLTKDAEFMNERIFTDIYYDTDNYSLTSKDVWLRSRENKFELKLPAHQGVDRLVDQYDEIEDETKIRENLNLPANRNLSDNLAKARYYPFCTCKTTRQKFKKEPFTIDIDLVQFPEFTYQIGEIEVMVNNKSEIDDAIEQIMTFAKENNLTIKPIRGKVIEYLKRIKPKHYQALVQAGVVKILINFI